MEHPGSRCFRLLRQSLFVLSTATAAYAADQATAKPASGSSPNQLGQLIAAIHRKAKGLETSEGMRLGFKSFTTAYKIQPESIKYSDYVVVRLLYDATRDAGFWNLHWTITNMPPNSDQIWRQWKTTRNSSFVSPTASAECDEFSALFAFLARRAGVHGIGLLWPYPNHTVAVWVV